MIMGDADQMSEDYWDSDAIDSDIEVRLYSQIYHRYEDADVVSHLKDSVKEIASYKSANSESSPTSSMNRSKTVELSDESSDNECSKSKAVSKKMTSRLESDTSETSAIDIFSSESEVDEVDDPGECSSRSRIQFGNLTDGSDEFLSLKYHSDESFSDDVVVISSSDEECRTPSLKKLPSKKAMNSFLEKCRPSYSPPKENVGNKQPSKTPVRKRVREVSIDLLNSLPGSSNKFKRIRMDPGESPDLWKVDNEDLKSNSSKRSKTRYYKQQKCTHCKEFTNHSTETCPFPRLESVCVICGEEGHTDMQCKLVICSKCLKTGHSAFRCSLNFKEVSCSMCQLQGHDEEICPNHWRQHHSTTHSGSKPKAVVKNTSRISCCSCGKTGHYGFECRQLFASRTSWPSSPFLKASPSMFNKAEISGRSVTPIVTYQNKPSPVPSTSRKQKRKKLITSIKERAMSLTPRTRKPATKKVKKVSTIQKTKVTAAVKPKVSPRKRNRNKRKSV